MAQADGDGDDGQRIPPRRRERQKMKQPRKLREHEKKLSEQRDFADAQQINRKRQHDGFGGERKRQVGLGGVEPRRRQPACEREHGEKRRLGAERLLALAGVQPVRPKGVERQQRAESRAGPESLRIKLFQICHAPAGRPACAAAQAKNFRMRLDRCEPSTNSTTLSTPRTSDSCSPENLEMKPSVTSNRPCVR